MSGFTLGLASEVNIRDVRVLIYGASGAGKTFAAATCLALDADPNDFAVALCTEPNGVLSIKHGAKGTNVFIPSWPCMVYDRDGHGEVRRDANGRPLFVQELDHATGRPKTRQHAVTLGEVNDFLKAVKTGQIMHNGRRPSAIIVDSLTDIFKMFREEVMADKRSKANTDERRAAAEVFSQQDYGTLESKFSAWMRSLRDLGLKTVCTALYTEDVEKSPDGVVIGRSYRPAFEGSTTRKIPGYFEVMGYVRRNTRPTGNGGFKESRTIMWTGPDRVACKGAAGLTGTTDMLKSRMSDVFLALTGVKVIHGPLSEDADLETEAQSAEPQDTEPTPATPEPKEQDPEPSKPDTTTPAPPANPRRRPPPANSNS